MRLSDEQLVDWIDIYEDSFGKWRWRAKSNNGDILADSGQGYADKSYAKELATKLFSEAPIRYPENEV